MDLDIDAVSIVTYDINKNGLLPLWSPYANQQSYELLDASMRLPVPTGNEVDLESTNDYQEAVNKLDKYRLLFLISQFQSWDKDIIVDLPNGKKAKGGWIPNTSKINLELDLNDSENIELLGELLQETELLIPSDDRIDLFTLALNRLGFAEFNLTKELGIDLISKVKDVIDKHNKYFETTSKYNLSKIINNYILYSMYKVSSDPVNLIQSHSPIDVITDPLKAIANNPEKLKEAEHRGSSTFVSKYAGIVENQVGKKGISICATAMKSYTGLTQYLNTILNSGDAAAQARLLLGKNHKGIQVGGKTYKTLANIRAKDTNTITNEDVLEALAQTTNDTDAVLVISAALSLSTDNAKELALDKLNASTKTLGMYMYGVAIGMDFNSIASILMSSAGKIINEVVNGDVFQGRKGYFSVTDSVFSYIENGPDLSIYNISKIGDNVIPNLVDVLRKEVAKLGYKNQEGEKLDLEEIIVRIANDPKKTLQQKIAFWDKYRTSYTFAHTAAKQKYNQLIDHIQKYMYQKHTVNLNLQNYKDLKVLSEGATEMKRLGRILSINQGLKTKSEEFITYLNLIERAIYDKKRNHSPKDIFDGGDMLDVIKLAQNLSYREHFPNVDPEQYLSDESYRNEMNSQFKIKEDLYRQNITYRELAIDKYEKVKHSFNIIECMLVHPLFNSYLTVITADKVAAMQSFKFRSLLNLTLPAKALIGYWDESAISKGILNYIGDYIWLSWISQSPRSKILIPAGNTSFTKYGTTFKLKYDTVVDLSTDWGRATFRLWMLREVIPKLKESGLFKNNQFIQDLRYDLFTKTVSKNPDILYTLPTRMMPKSDSEKQILNDYILEFNKLEKETYSYKDLSINIIDLFTLYTMIAHGWKMGESSLVPIFRDFLNKRLIQDFHNFESRLDKSGVTLRIRNADELKQIDTINRTGLYPYIAPYENPNQSIASYLWWKDPISRKVRLMRKMGKSDYERLEQENAGNQEERRGFDSSRVGNYIVVSGNKVNRNLFKSGNVEIPNYSKTYTLENTNVEIQFSEDGYIYSIKFTEGENVKELVRKNAADFFTKEEKDAIFCNQDGHLGLNDEVVEALLNDKQFPC